jgi:cytochrome oxidase Cu insertion factor (SCO1/SenC/PrrC family)
MALIFTGGYIAVARVAVRVVAAQPVADFERDESGSVNVRARLVGRLDRLEPTYLLRALLALLALAVVLIGAAPMALAATNSNADPIVIEAANGVPSSVNVPAPAFTLTDTSGRSVSLASLRGRTVALTFLDPVCTSDCPEIAQSLREADQNLGAQARNVELVAVVDNPLYRSAALTAAFDRQEHLNQVPNWIYLTGSLAQLEKVWDAYGAETVVSPAGGMVAHLDLVYVIDKQGRTRVVLDADPGDGNAQGSSFVGQLTSEIGNVINS